MDDDDLEIPRPMDDDELETPRPMEDDIVEEQQQNQDFDEDEQAELDEDIDANALMHPHGSSRFTVQDIMMLQIKEQFCRLQVHFFGQPETITTVVKPNTERLTGNQSKKT